MTMRVVDIAPNEAPLIALAEQWEKAVERGEPLTEEDIRSFARMNREILEPAKSARGLADAGLD
jgi:hypothetical protein